ncbi:hypothetical protein JTE90_010124 [Oedothorax gibbosus]|uniref:Uncharacterized protein n=1 Tax=Oedothorax gibbosus TaxID=931172 RepID=A0AAV6UF27_9ARAC|nr:hypothetical protein JTE90_010124 [Oedothorax gibbosus]
MHQPFPSFHFVSILNIGSYSNFKRAPLRRVGGSMYSIGFCRQFSIRELGRHPFDEKKIRLEKKDVPKELTHTQDGKKKVLEMSKSAFFADLHNTVKRRI